MKNAIKTIIFIAIFGIILYFLMKTMWLRENALSYFYDEPKNTIDVAYIGASNAFYNYNPTLAYNTQGYTTGMLGTANQMIASYKYLLEEAKQYQNPKLYVIDLARTTDNYTDFKEEDARRILDSMPYSENKINAIKALTEYMHVEEDQIPSYYFSFLMYHNSWKDINEENFTGSKEYYKGYFFYGATLKIDPRPESIWQDEVEELSEENNKYFIDLLDYIKQNNLNVLFIIPPRMYPLDSNKKLNYEANIIKEYGFDIINFNTTEDYTINYAKDFMDNVHLNIYGSTKFTLYFSNYLKNHYNLPDHREDENYSTWKSEYERLEADFKELTKLDFSKLIEIVKRNENVDLDFLTNVD